MKIIYGNYIKFTLRGGFLGKDVCLGRGEKTYKKLPSTFIAYLLLDVLIVVSENSKANNQGSHLNLEMS